MIKNAVVAIGRTAKIVWTKKAGHPVVVERQFFCSAEIVIRKNCLRKSFSQMSFEW
jgi:hypothetical protein